MTTKIPNSMLETPGTSGAVAQVKSSSTSATMNLATNIPLDETIPQITEGNEVLTVSITPTSASNYLEVEAILQISADATSYAIAAVFVDSTANAIGAACMMLGMTSPQWTYPNQLVVRARVLAGSTSAKTIRLRAGGTGAATLRINQTNSGTQLFGGGAVTKLTVMEVAP